MSVTRRRACWAGLLPLTSLAPLAGNATNVAAAALAELEHRNGGRLGVAVLDTGTGQLTGHRQDERFALCSTFKLLLAAAVLQQVDAGRLQLRQWVPLKRSDRVPHAPVAGPAIARGGMPVEVLAKAIQVNSDNMAANALMRLLGGPSGLTLWLRTLGDEVTRIDRWEPEMNRVAPGEVRDTTTPAAMARSTARLVLGNVLSARSRTRLQGWLVQTQTGLERLRAGLPPDWRAGDKTGTGQHPSYADKINDVAVLWPPLGRAPVVVAAYYESPVTTEGPMRAQDQAVLAEVGRWVSH